MACWQAGVLSRVQQVPPEREGTPWMGVGAKEVLGHRPAPCNLETISTHRVELWLPSDSGPDSVSRGLSQGAPGLTPAVPGSLSCGASAHLEHSRRFLEPFLGGIFDLGSVGKILTPSSAEMLPSVQQPFGQIVF